MRDSPNGFMLDDVFLYALAYGYQQSNYVDRLELELRQSTLVQKMFHSRKCDKQHSRGYFLQSHVP
jgi:hypothetical protein